MSSHDHSYHPVLGKFNADVASVSRSIDAKQEELRAAYQRIDELTKALTIARKQIITLGGDEPEGCQIQQAVLGVIEMVLS